jgi:hypothetical protein
VRAQPACKKQQPPRKKDDNKSQKKSTIEVMPLVHFFFQVQYQESFWSFYFLVRFQYFMDNCKHAFYMLLELLKLSVMDLIFCSAMSALLCQELVACL